MASRRYQHLPDPQQPLHPLSQTTHALLSRTRGSLLLGSRVSALHFVTRKGRSFLRPLAEGKAQCRSLSSRFGAVAEIRGCDVGLDVKSQLVFNDFYVIL